MMKLCRYADATTIREATIAEARESVSAAQSDGGRGVIWVDGVDCYVQGDPLGDADFAAHACNLYPELVAALTALIPWVCKGLEHGAYAECVLPLAPGRAIDAALAVLAKCR